MRTLSIQACCRRSFPTQAKWRRSRCWNPGFPSVGRRRDPDGPVSIVLSRTDALMVVLRNGVEIGRARVQVRTPGLVVGTRAYVMGSGYMPGVFPQFPGGRAPQWMEVAVPGHEANEGLVVDPDAINNVAVPPDFLDQLFPLLQPGTVVVATDAPILPSGPRANMSVLDDSPPGS